MNDKVKIEKYMYNLNHFQKKNEYLLKINELIPIKKIEKDLYVLSTNKEKKNEYKIRKINLYWTNNSKKNYFFPKNSMFFYICCKIDKKVVDIIFNYLKTVCKNPEKLFLEQSIYYSNEKLCHICDLVTKDKEAFLICFRVGKRLILNKKYKICKNLEDILTISIDEFYNNLYIILRNIINE